MRCHFEAAGGGHKLLSVIALIGSERHPSRTGDLFEHRHRRFALGAAGGWGHSRIDHQAVAVLHQRMSEIGELGFASLAFLVQPGLRVGGRLVSGVGALVAMEVHRRVAWVVWRTGLWWSLLRSKTLLTRPCLDEGAIDRKVLIRKEMELLRLLEHPTEQGQGDVARQQPLAVLGEHRRHPDRVVHPETDEPPEQKVVVELLHQHPLAADGEQDLQQQGPQQLLGRNRRPPDLRVQRLELRRQLHKGRIHHLANPPQWVALGNPRLQRDVAEHAALPHVRSPHRPVPPYALFYRSLRGFSAAC